MEDLLTFGLLAAYLLMIALDFVAPARAFPRMRWWRAKGIAFTVVYLAVSTTLPFLWDAHFAAHRLFDLTGLGTLGGAAVALIGYELVAYGWHRALHGVPFLWRWFHQLHHAAERVDVFGAFHFSPLDMLGWSLTTSVSMVLLVGVTPEAALLAGTVLTFLSFFAHSNVRTPAWLGWFIQRPENHALHHQRGVHAYNYADLSFVDMIFGTFRNPERWEDVGGFYDGASERVLDMLMGRDVATPPTDERARPATPSPRPAYA